MRYHMLYSKTKNYMARNQPPEYFRVKVSSKLIEALHNTEHVAESFLRTVRTITQRARGDQDMGKGAADFVRNQTRQHALSSLEAGSHEESIKHFCLPLRRS
jgi:hypothetical protein